MSDEARTSDAVILDVLRKRGGLTVLSMAKELGVTATAIRQRLGRLIASGLIQRETSQPKRGRPSHHYSLTEKGRRPAGDNFADLAIALWQEVRAVPDISIRRGLLQRISQRMGEGYRRQLVGREGRDARLEGLAEIFRSRQVPFEVDRSNPLLPVLTALACPYPDLAEQDRSVCSLERMMFSGILGENVRLSSCRLDGEQHCVFSPANEHDQHGATPDVHAGNLIPLNN